MNEHDLLEAIGDIDPKFIEAADRPNRKQSKIVHFQKFYLAAAGLFLLIVAGVVLRNGTLIHKPDTGAIEEVDEFAIETMDSITQDQLPTDTAGLGKDDSIMMAGSPESAAETAEESGNETFAEGFDANGIANKTDGTNLEVTGANAESVNKDRFAKTESANADFPAMIMVNGFLYADSGEDYWGTIDLANAVPVLSYIDGEPAEDGAQNFDRNSAAKYFIIDDESIAVDIDGSEESWIVFKKIK